MGNASFSRKYRLLCRQFADIYPAHRFCKLLQLRYRQFNRAVAAPARRKTVSYFFKVSSRYTRTPSLIPNGQTPPIACPIRSSTSSGASIFAFAWKMPCILHCQSGHLPHTRSAPPLRPPEKTGSFAIRPASVCSASAASSTVAEGRRGTPGSDLPSYILLNMPLLSPATSHKPLFLRQEVSFLLLLSCTLPRYSIAIHHTLFHELYRIFSFLKISKEGCFFEKPVIIAFVLVPLVKRLRRRPLTAKTGFDSPRNCSIS